MRVIDCEQGSVEWWTAKRGIPSASNFDRIMTPAKRKLSASITPFICELLAEKTSLVLPGGGPMTSPMRDGVICEPKARSWYEMEVDRDVRRVGFITTDDGRFGCSPDGLVGDDGGLELKCPELKTHIGYLLAGTVPDEYLCQVHGNLIVTGRPWWDFVSYAEGWRPLRVRTTPNDFTEDLLAALEVFFVRYQEVLSLLRQGGAVPLKLDGGAEPVPLLAGPPDEEPAEGA